MIYLGLQSRANRFNAVRKGVEQNEPQQSQAPSQASELPQTSANTPVEAAMASAKIIINFAFDRSIVRLLKPSNVQTSEHWNVRKFEQSKIRSFERRNIQTFGFERIAHFGMLLIVFQLFVMF